MCVCALLCIAIVAFKCLHTFYKSKKFIVVSLIVYNDISIIREQIDNVKKYVDDVAIVIHLNQTSPTSFHDVWKLCKQYNDVILNETQLRMDSPHSPSPNSILDIIVSNFRYAKRFYHFDYYVVNMSNERYVKHGLVDFLREKRPFVGMSCIPYHNCENKMDIPELVGNHECNPWGRKNDIENDPWLRSMLGTSNDVRVFYGQIDGSFYRKDMMDAFVEAFDIILFPQFHGQAMELYLPTFFNHMHVPIQHGITYFNWFGEITKDIILRMRSDPDFKPNQFAVKRVNADDIEIREFIHTT